ncbi:two-component system sensor histidine kinase YesM [Gracilibacillus halotolerans]|uniref:Two-component system sensor histidine kinase YesM n=1 Tax=Gracilibacillus halotolerans TaxID=74386 RepID=A0A841RKS9_9BACI|nr:sensor histidine kinase [Gracilibacillus halotolerans]MBB6512223.1 two-component system sensor histidine kinase YesM [Gracilibacillus halotolerans]
MKRIHFNDVRLRNKLLLIYMFSVFLPIILTNIIFYLVTSENVREQKLKDNELALQQVVNNFRQGVEDAAGVAAVLYSDALLYEFLDKEYENPVDFIHGYNNNFRDINRYTPGSSSITLIHLYTENPTVITAGGIFPINDQTKEEQWYKDTENARQEYPILTRKKTENGRLDEFVVVRDLGSHNRKYEKIVMVHLSKRFVIQSFDSVTFEGDIYLVNADGEIQYSTATNQNWIQEAVPFRSIEIEDEAIVMNEEYQHRFLEGWQVIGVIPKANLTTEVRNSIYSIFYLALFNFVIPSLFITYIAGNIHFRMKSIVSHMRKVKDEQFEVIKGKKYKDEIGLLTAEYNRMTRKIKQLINDVYKVRIQKQDLELEKKDAQLKALQSQINPHFLFNVLETIRMRSVLKDEWETAEIIRYLAQLLRTSISWEKDWVTVGEEVRLIQAFLEIQKYRFDDKMKYTIEMDEAVKSAYIPNMTFIPFVENASIHGIEPLKGKGNIKITISCLDNDRLSYVIKDDGVGMEQSKYEEIMSTLADEEISGENIGIRNVSQRLKMYYGTEYELNITTEKNIGTTVQIILPIIQRVTLD